MLLTVESTQLMSLFGLGLENKNPGSIHKKNITGYLLIY